MDTQTHTGSRPPGRPRVSVIVPVKDRRPHLHNLLTALEAQTLTDYELVVVDDGSTDGSDDEARWAAARGVPVRVVQSSGRGAVAARDAGIRAATGVYLAFTDSDCMPAPGWLAAGVAALDTGVDVAQGLTVPQRPPRTLERSLAAGEEGLYATCNVFYRRGAYEAAGGFDPAVGRRLRFRPGRRLQAVGFGEDTLLGWRIRRAGRAEFVPDAVVSHYVFPADLRESLRRAWSTGAFPGLVREVPELRRTMLVGGVFLEVQTRAGLYAALVLRLLGRRRLAALAVAAWVAARARRAARRERSLPRTLAVLPADLTVDAVTAAALVLGSARTRTPVL